MLNINCIPTRFFSHYPSERHMDASPFRCNNHKSLEQDAIYMPTHVPKGNLVT
jgi:hypothetical protein